MAVGHRCTQLVHICGFPSGGTDLLRHVMNSHPDIELVHELPLLAQLADRFDAQIPGGRVSEFATALRKGDVNRELRNADADLSHLAALPSVAVADIYSIMLTQADVKWKGNKTPQNTENMDRLLHLFPEGRFILIARDVRDICLSWRKKWGKHILFCAEKWRSRMLQGCRFIAALPPGRGMIVRFEELLREPETIERQICQFLDIPFDPQMLAYHEHISSVEDGHKNAGRPIDPGIAGKWQTGLSPQEVHRIEEIAYETMQHLGYQPTSAHAARPINTLERVMGFGTDSFAAVFIGNRYKSRHRFSARILAIHIILRRSLPFN